MLRETMLPPFQRQSLSSAMVLTFPCVFILINGSFYSIFQNCQGHNQILTTRTHSRCICSSLSTSMVHCFILLSSNWSKLMNHCISIMVHCFILLSSNWSKFLNHCISIMVHCFILLSSNCISIMVHCFILLSSNWSKFMNHCISISAF